MGVGSENKNKTVLALVIGRYAYVTVTGFCLLRRNHSFISLGSTSLPLKKSIDFLLEILRKVVDVNLPFH